MPTPFNRLCRHHEERGVDSEGEKWLEFWLEEIPESWLEIPYIEKLRKNECNLHI